MIIKEHNSIGQIAVDYVQTIEVFDIYGVDYYCFGYKTISDVCDEMKIELDKFLKDLNDSLLTQSTSINVYGNWSLEQLFDHVDNIHMDLRDKIYKSKSFMEALEEDYQKLKKWKDVKLQFTMLENQLSKHHSLEERFTIPYFRKLQEANVANEPIPRSFLGDLEQHIDIMRLEHEIIAYRHKRIIALLNIFYQTNETSVERNTSLLHELSILEKKLQEYIHLENNVVFDKIINLKNKMSQIQ